LQSQNVSVGIFERDVVVETVTPTSVDAGVSKKFAIAYKVVCRPKKGDTKKEGKDAVEDAMDSPKYPAAVQAELSEQFSALGWQQTLPVIKVEIPSGGKEDATPKKTTSPGASGPPPAGTHTFTGVTVALTADATLLPSDFQKQLMDTFQTGGLLGDKSNNFAVRAVMALDDGLYTAITKAAAGSSGLRLATSNPRWLLLLRRPPSTR
jgi:hypothetical protein